jgi:hypothetical protein
MPDQPHAFKVSEYSTTFIRVESELAIIRWIPINTQDQTGMGYLSYEIGLMKYTSTA